MVEPVSKMEHGLVAQFFHVDDCIRRSVGVSVHLKKSSQPHVLLLMAVRSL